MDILSVDFDIIMSPCIKLYNHLSAGDANSTELWNFIENNHEVDKFLCYDYNTLHDISILMKKSIANGAEFITIDEHNKLVDNLLDKYPNEKFSITNIDFHHDIAYNKQAIDNIKNFNKYSCADWVAYLALKGYLKKYTWVKAPNSDNCQPEFVNLLNCPYEVISKRLISNINPEFSQVYFCLSPQWVPYKYNHLYKLISELVEVRV